MNSISRGLVLARVDTAFGTAERREGRRDQWNAVVWVALLVCACVGLAGAQKVNYCCVNVLWSKEWSLISSLSLAYTNGPVTHARALVCSFFTGARTRHTNTHTHARAHSSTHTLPVSLTY